LLSGIDVARVVKKLAERAGLDAAKYAGHLLRVGHATRAAIAGASERSIMNQTGHRSVQIVRRYIRDGSLFRENSAGKLGAVVLAWHRIRPEQVLIWLFKQHRTLWLQFGLGLLKGGRMRYLAPAIFGCICALAQTPVPGAKPEDKCSIEGTVVNAATGEPVQKARLFLQPVGTIDRKPYATTTDSAGHFLIDEVEPGTYDLAAFRNGYPNQSYLSNGNYSRRALLTLEKGQELKQIVFKLRPNAAISGRILDEEGEPMNNVNVECMALDRVQGKRQLVANSTTSTNDLGEFRLIVSTADKCVIKATAQDQDMYGFVEERPMSARVAAQPVEQRYVSTYYPNTANSNNATPLDVSRGAQISGITMTLLRNRGVAIKGHVTVANALCGKRTGVGISQANARESVASSTVDSQGNFLMRGIPSGSYLLFAGCRFDGKMHTARMPIEVRDANIEGIELTLEPPVEVQGRVIIEGADDLKDGAHLTLLSDDPDSGGRDLQLKADLTFKLEGMTAGPYHLSRAGTPEEFYLKSIHMGEQDVTETGIDLTPGVPADLTIVLSANSGVIEGSVQTAKDEPAKGAAVILIRAPARKPLQRRYTASTDQNGHFIIKGIAPGEWKIYAWEEIEAGAEEDPDFMKPHESQGESVSIKERGHETVQLKVIPTENTNRRTEGPK
jgi:hypothetical protein